MSAENYSRAKASKLFGILSQDMNDLCKSMSILEDNSLAELILKNVPKDEQADIIGKLAEAEYYVGLGWEIILDLWHEQLLKL